MNYQIFKPDKQKYLGLYKQRGIEVDLILLDKIIAQGLKDGKKNYQKLKKPKIMSENMYIQSWIYNLVSYDIAKRSVERVDPKDKVSKYQASIDFYLTYPPSDQKRLRETIWSASPNKRELAWKNLRIPFKKIVEAFKKLTIQRSQLTVRFGFKSFLEYCLNLYQISNSDYKIFLTEIDKIIDYCNKQVLVTGNFSEDFFSEFGNHCYLCALKSFPFKDLKEVENFLFSKNDDLKKFRSKISIKLGNYSQVSYKKGSDTFGVTIEKAANLRHKSIDLIHELSHIVHRLELYEKGFLVEEKGAYYNERETAKIELNFLKQKYNPLYKSVYGEFLKVFHKVLFEIELYQNPNQDLSRLYATTFNRCFKGANQKQNRSFILDEEIMQRPLSKLPHAVAQAMLIKKFYNHK